MDIFSERTISIYTDGSSYSSPRKGGVGVRVIFLNTKGEEEYYDYSPPGYTNATNNQMELQACIDALEIILGRNSPVDIKRVRHIIIHTDSMYITDNINNATYKWPKNNWISANGGPVLNAEQWQILIKFKKKLYNSRVYVEFKWVKGHKLSAHNKAADKLAKASAKRATKKVIYISSVRRKKSKLKTEIGSVKAKGQRITIRIIDDQYLKPQSLYRYRFEVMSRRSEYYRKVDFITSKVLLKAGHTYFVLLNSNPMNPVIEKSYREVLSGRG